MTIGVDLSDGGVAALAALPFAPGDSPFRVKGTAYRGHLEFVAGRIPGGVEAMLARMDEPPGLRAFYEQPFLASSLYDVFPLAWGGVVCARMMGMPYLEFVRMRAAEQAKADVGGIYRVLLALASPNAVAHRLPRLLAQYFDFGGSVVEKNEPGHVLTTRSGMPAPLVPWYEKVTESYCAMIIGRAGAKDFTLRAERVPAGSAHGVPLVDIHFDFRFR